MAELSSGIIGVGQMGGRMGRRLVAVDASVVAFDRDEQRLAACGIPAVTSVAALVGQADVVLLSLPDSTIVEPVVLGPGGVAEHARKGQVIVDLSTSSPESTQRIHAALAERGVRFLDAGISGGPKAAETGKLTIMVGGEVDALEAARPVVDRLATNVLHMGPSGSGHVTKLLNNFLNGMNLAATAEVMVAARKSGLDLRRFLEVLNGSSGANYATLQRFPSIVEGDYLDGGLSGRLMAKDIRLYLEHLARIGVPTFNGPSCLGTFEVANGMGYGDVVSNRVVDAIGDLAGGVRLQDDGPKSE
jgi:3-hydroxyisobutyrate dehydrogenase-like beta-hydroxyacid dehydrogenase